MRRLATAAFSFSGAVLLAQSLPFGPWVYWCAFSAVAAALFGFLFKATIRLRVFLILPAVAAGLLWTAGYRQLSLVPAAAFDGTTADAVAVVTNSPEQTDYGAKLVVKLHTDTRPVKALLYVYGDAADTIQDARPGNTIRFTARFRLADEIYGEKTTSYFDDGVFLIAQSQGALEITDRSSSPVYLPARIAHAASEMAGRIFTADTSGFMQALLLGDTTELSADHALSAALRASGTSHIVSVSGMNIAFLTGLLGFFIRKKRTLSFVAMPVILFFMAVVGFTPSVVRAGVMQFFLLTAPLIRREDDAVTSLSASLFVILLANPFAAAGAGLQLSFAATLGILLFTGRLFDAADRRLKDSFFYRFTLTKKTLRFIVASLATTLGALALTMPVSALHFGTVSLIAPLSNLIIIPAVTLAFVAGTAAVALGFIHVSLGTLAAYAAVLPVRFISGVAVRLSDIPFASVYTTNMPILIWLVFVYLTLITVLSLRVNLRRLVMPGCAAVILFCLTLLLTAFTGYRAQMTVTALDVGQGQCVVVESGAFTAVVDCGSLGKDAAAVLEGYLQGRGRLRIDLLILTHFHEDHAGSIPDVLQRLKVDALALPGPSIDNGPLTSEILTLALRQDTQIITVDENLSVMTGTARLNLYAPLGSADENERGVAVLCSEGNFDTLITGDMSAPIERRLVASDAFPDIEALVVGHHGSKRSTSDELLKALRPEIAVISVGYNTYGHPSPETLDKLWGAGITVYRTDLCGTVTLHAPAK
jgi:competence protein ComEC